MDGFDGYPLDITSRAKLFSSLINALKAGERHTALLGNMMRQLTCLWGKPVTTLLRLPVITDYAVHKSRL